MDSGPIMFQAQKLIADVHVASAGFSRCPTKIDGAVNALTFSANHLSTPMIRVFEEILAEYSVMGGWTRQDHLALRSGVANSSTLLVAPKRQGGLGFPGRTSVRG